MLAKLWINLVNSYFAEQHRWVHWLPVGLILGIAHYFSIKSEPEFFSYFSLVIMALSAVIWTRRNPNLALFTFLIVGYCLGFCLSGAKVRNNPVQMVNATQKIARISGKIESVENHPYQTDATLRIVLDQVTIDDKSYQAKLRLNVPSTQAQNWNIGDQLQAQVSIYPIPMPSSLHGYFARRDAFLSGIGGTARLHQLIAHKNATVRLFAQFRHKITQQLLLKLQAPYGAVAAALVTGDRSYIPTDLRQAFADAGLAHVLAISGLHLSLIAGLVFLLLRRLMCLWPALSNCFTIKKIAAVLATIASALYMAIANFGIPVQRSFVMISLAMGAICLDRTAFSMRSLSIAAAVVLIFSPASLLSASFQLSFSAVLGLLAFYESGWLVLQEKVAKNSSDFLGLKKFFWGFFGIFMTTLIASLATTPFSIAFFQRFTAQAILGNLMAIPLVGFLIMPLGLFSVLSLIFGGMDGLFWLWQQSLKLLCIIANYVALLPGAAIRVKAVPPEALIIFSMGMLWLCLWKKFWRWLGIMPILLSIILWRMYELPIAYVSQQCDMIAYQQQDIAYVSDLQRNTFTSDIWSQEWGIEKRELWRSGYHHFKKPNLLLIVNPKEAMLYLRELHTWPDIVVTFGYANTLIIHGLQISQIIDRDLIKRQGGLAIFTQSPYVCFLKDYFGQRHWSVN